MADVLVIAILMTFIGFNGIVNNTLSDLNMNNGTITSITTNNTSIQPGYIIFIGFRFIRVYLILHSEKYFTSETSDCCGSEIAGLG